MDVLLSVYALGACVLALFWFFSRSTFDYWKRRNVFFFKPLPFVGNFGPILLVRLSMNEFLQKMYRQLDHLPYGGFFEMRSPVLLVKDPELITHILITDFKHFTDHGFDFLNPSRKLNPLNVNIFNETGQRWKMLRQKMTPVFTVNKLKTMQEQFLCCTSMLLDHLEATAEEVNLKDAFDRFAIDVLGMCAFGLECSSSKSNDQFKDLGFELFKPSLRKGLPFLCRTFSARLLEILQLPDFPVYITNFYTNLLLDTVHYRRQKKVVRNDLLQTLMDLQNDAVDPKYAPERSKSSLTGDSFDEIDIVANAFLIFVGAFESTSLTLSFCLYELALNQKIQNNLRDEVTQTRAKYEDKQCYECYHEMTYMEQVILETTRKYPPIPVLYRKCVEDYIMPKTGLKLQRGDKINIPVWSVHHDWRYYPNPELFDPDRFSAEQKKSRPAGTFLPFGEGPRYCMGKRFVTLEIKTVLSELLLKYDFVPCSKTEIPIVLKKSPFSTVAEDGPWIRLVKRPS